MGDSYRDWNDEDRFGDSLKTKLVSAEKVTTGNHLSEPLCERTAQAIYAAVADYATLQAGSDEDFVSGIRSVAGLIKAEFLPPPDPAREERERILGLLRSRQDLYAYHSDDWQLFQYVINDIERLDHHTAEG